MSRGGHKVKKADVLPQSCSYLMRTPVKPGSKAETDGGTVGFI